MMRFGLPAEVVALVADSANARPGSSEAPTAAPMLAVTPCSMPRLLINAIWSMLRIVRFLLELFRTVAFTNATMRETTHLFSESDGLHQDKSGEAVNAGFDSTRNRAQTSSSTDPATGLDMKILIFTVQASVRKRWTAEWPDRSRRVSEAQDAAPSPHLKGVTSELTMDANDETSSHFTPHAVSLRLNGNDETLWLPAAKHFDCDAVIGFL